MVVLRTQSLAQDPEWLETLNPEQPYAMQVLDEESDEEEDVPINGILVGAGENTFLQRGSRFSVLRNQARGGMEDAHIQFTLTPSRMGGGGGGDSSTPLNARGTSFIQFSCRTEGLR